MIEPINFKARDIPLYYPQTIWTSIGGYSSLNYSACLCASRLPACCCTWVGVRNISTQFSYKVNICNMMYHFIKIYDTDRWIVACKGYGEWGFHGGNSGGLDTSWVSTFIRELVGRSWFARLSGALSQLIGFTRHEWHQLDGVQGNTGWVGTFWVRW